MMLEKKQKVIGLLKNAPHPIPYQGSKRRLASHIAPFITCTEIKRFIEPFSGSAALSLYLAQNQLAEKFVINDSLQALMELWREIINSPEDIASRYEQIWLQNLGNEATHFLHIRSAFNEDGDPAKLLYLLARCVKNAVRFNSKGEFNQSADMRRLGTKPARMRNEIKATSEILQGKSSISSKDYQEVLHDACVQDLVYLDPPWEGTSGTKDTRYHQLLNKADLISCMERMNSKNVPFLLSFDGRLGNKRYGDGFPDELQLLRLEIDAGRSAQATLSGNDHITYESLYLSPAIVHRLELAGQRNLIEQYLPNSNDF